MKKNIRENSSKVYNVLKKLYTDVVDYVKENQGEKGFVTTLDGDSIYVYQIIYEEYYQHIDERQLIAIKVVDDTLMLLADYNTGGYTDDAIAETSADDWTAFNLFGDEFVNASTLLSICECIEEY